MNCVGLDINSDQIGALCLPPTAGLLPQMGVFQGLYMTIMSDIRFSSDPPEYLEKGLFPKLTGDYDCDGRTCEFPYAGDQYRGSMGYMALGGVILTLFGFILVSVFSYPGKRVLMWKASFRNCLRSFFCCLSGRKPSADSNVNDDTAAQGEEMSPEVLEEISCVEEIVAPFVAVDDSLARGGSGGQRVSIPDYDAIPRNEIPPVIAHKLRKEYQLPGGFSTKLALKSLDLHVP